MHPRGIKEVEVVGKKRLMRPNLMAIANIESRLGKSIDLVLADLGREESPKVLPAIVMFEEFCKAGGTPCDADEINGFGIEDAFEIIEAIRLCLDNGDEEETTSPKKPAPKRRGANGKK